MCDHHFTVYYSVCGLCHCPISYLHQLTLFYPLTLTLSLLSHSIHSLSISHTLCTESHTHTYIYIYIYICVCVCVTSSYSTWMFCRGVSGFATDFPCDVWCRWLTTCLLHVGPPFPFGNRFLNNSWALGLTKWIVYLHFLYFDICNYIYLDTSYHCLALSVLLKYSFFSSTPVLTSSIDVVLVERKREREIDRDRDI